MSQEIETFFRRCPNCGRRFEIRLVGKKLVNAESIPESRPVNPDYFGGQVGHGRAMGAYLEVSETEPTIIEVDKFQYAYKCKHCGHQWVEIKEKEYRQA
jgi:DNA-directed RNA polymerase subunit RPC12/RpoP